jgi:hypothetical protein
MLRLRSEAREINTISRVNVLPLRALLGGHSRISGVIPGLQDYE